MRPVLLLLFVLLMLPGLARAQASLGARVETTAAPAAAADEAAVRAAVLDYVEGVYEVAPDRIRRSVHPALAKVGYWLSEDGAAYQEVRMTFDQLVELSKTWNKEGRVDAATARKDVVLLDLLDQTATVKLSAVWGVDYMHLARHDGRWMIMNVLWQSYPPDSQ